MSGPQDFPHHWQAEILSAPPLITPARHFVYPQRVPGEEEAISRGALHLMVHSPNGDFLATCALGFDTTSVPTGIHACANPGSLCAIAGGYAYIINTAEPAHCHFLPMRPVVAVHAVPANNLLLFVGFHNLLAFGLNSEGRESILWQSARLTWEGLRITGIADGKVQITDGKVRGYGWHMPSDSEMPFTVSLADGTHTGGAFSSTE